PGTDRTPSFPLFPRRAGVAAAGPVAAGRPAAPPPRVGGARAVPAVHHHAARVPPGPSVRILNSPTE
ncbi:hypothetical protein, partial [Streptomyces alkaliterrae]|uniref:hypothetical protein n=1 Tax=Streptomyces alkaliterrae TaxID=2213162 RepID=UPI001E3F67FA